MDPITQQTVIAAAGAGGGDPVYVDDVFSTFLWEGTGSNQTINNGIDLAGEGGLVWTKNRVGSTSHFLNDSARGKSGSYYDQLSTDSSAGSQVFTPWGATSFNSNGFSLGGSNSEFNLFSNAYVSWTFRKAPGFFDVVTYTGNGTNGRQISHALGSIPGMVIVKRTNGNDNWTVQHRSLGGTKSLYLNLTNAEDVSASEWNNTAATSTVFTVGTSGKTNANGDTYVAYIFAHDDTRFGTGKDESIIKCGSYTGNATSGTLINLGWEPQWVLIKKSSGSENWFILDTMRGLVVGTGEKELFPNLNAAESGGNNRIDPDALGFRLSDFNDNYATYIYIAIRRPHKPLTAGTDVFGIDKLSGSQSYPAFRPGIVTDMGWARRLNSGAYYGNGVGVWSRLTGDKFMGTGSTAAEGNDSFGGDNMVGFYSSAISGDIGYSFKRAPGFFDVVCYDGAGYSATARNHALGVAPEMMIAKKRTGSNQSWWVYHKDANSPAGATAGELSRGSLDTNGAWLGETPSGSGAGNMDWGNTAPNSTVFYVGNNANDTNSEYVAYLFSTLPGVSKLGSYTGTGNNITVNCGFSTGARFVLIKRIDALGDWYVYDSARGIVSGNDPYFFLNNSGAEVAATDYIDPLSSGFTVTSSASSDLNTSGGKYIFLAIA